MRSQNNQFNDIFEMIKIQFWINNRIENQRTLKNNQMYNMIAIQHSVLVIFNKKENYYVNNYVNWNLYNMIYNFDFLKIDVKRTKTFDENLRWCHVLITYRRNSLKINQDVHFQIWKQMKRNLWTQWIENKENEIDLLNHCKWIDVDSLNYYKWIEIDLLNHCK